MTLQKTHSHKHYCPDCHADWKCNADYRLVLVKVQTPLDKILRVEVEHKA